MVWGMSIAICCFICWIHAVIVRLRKRDSNYNKYVFGAAIILYLTCNFIQTQTFTYKTVFSIFFIVYSLVAIPFHIWLMVSWTKEKKPTSH